MKNYNLKFKNCKILKTFILNEKKEIAEKLTQIYSQGKSPDSPGSFRFERTGKTNKTTL
jgi:hypothetical protein